MVRARPLSSIERKSTDTMTFKMILGLQPCGNSLGKALSCFRMTMPVHKARSIQKWYVKIDVEELDWPEP
jgi:hypothetical protein